MTPDSGLMARDGTAKSDRHNPRNTNAATTVDFGERSYRRPAGTAIDGPDVEPGGPDR